LAYRVKYPDREEEAVATVRYQVRLPERGGSTEGPPTLPGRHRSAVDAPQPIIRGPFRRPLMQEIPTGDWRQLAGLIFA